MQLFQAKRLLIAAYILLWPPFLILAMRRSYAPQFLGWWSYRVAAILAVAALFVITATVLLIRILRSEPALARFQLGIASLRYRRSVLILAVGLPTIVLLVVVGYLVLLGVRLDWPLFVSLVDLMLLLMVWNTAIMFIGRRARQQRLLLINCIASSFALVLSVLCVEVVGHLLHMNQQTTWQVNPPNLDIRFRTDDFDVTVITNGQGLREHDEVSAEHPGVFRIVAVGDSYTFGWGVENDEAYTKVAESVLRNQYGWKNVEIINMGRPGAAPHDYLKFIKQYVPKLNPDLVLVGFLMGDDCPVSAPPWATDDEQIEQELSTYIEFAQINHLEQALAHSYIFRVASAALLPRLRATPTWRSKGKRGPIFREPNPLDPIAMERQLRDHENPVTARARYERLKQQGWVTKGLKWEVNPWLIMAVALRPAGPVDSLAVRPETKDYMPNEWRLCEGLLREMARSIRDEMNAEMVVLAVPNAHLVSQRWVDFLRDTWECPVHPKMTSTRIVNDWMREFCDKEVILCVDPLEQVRAETRVGTELYLKTDDHMNAAGQRLLGEILAAELFERFGSQPQ